MTGNPRDQETETENWIATWTVETVLIVEKIGNPGALIARTESAQSTSGNVTVPRAVQKAVQPAVRLPHHIPLQHRLLAQLQWIDSSSPRWTQAGKPRSCQLLRHQNRYERLSALK